MFGSFAQPCPGLLVGKVGQGKLCF
uniref:Uncharacterized protein n=1 Tax=Arundo donax TaxID=35708 RepID=A0A0A9AJ89_ARUDO